MKQKMDAGSSSVKFLCCKKRIVSLVLSLAILLSILPLNVLAEESVVAYGVEGGNIYFDTISGTVTDADETITEVVIPTEIKGVTVNIIGDYAFDSCYDLKNIILPEGLISIGTGAFEDCDGLTSIVLPNKVVSIGDDAFEHCTYLTSIDLPDSLTSIGAGAFWSCIHLSEIDLPNALISIGDWAFANCNALENIELPENLTMIGEYAFSECTKISQIVIPAKVNEIGTGAFSHNKNLLSIVVEDNNLNFSNDDFGVLYDSRKTRMIQCPGGIRGEYTLPEGVTTIEDGGFAGCSKLTNINFPKSLTSIGSYAFEYCDSLTGIDLVDGIIAINASTFYSCDNLENVTIPDSLKIIEYGAFYNCVSLTSIILPNGLTSIGHSAFYGCYGLTDALYNGTSEQWESVTVDADNQKLLDVLRFTDADSDILPTIENFTLNGQSESVTVEVGEVLTLGGIIEGNGNNLNAVSVAIRSLADEGKGGKWHTGEGVNLDVESFDLSDFNDTVVTAGEAFGNTTLMPGEYVVQVYATNQDGKGFEQAHKINLTIKEKEPEAIYPTIKNFTLNGQAGDVTVEVGEALSLSGIVSGNGSNLSAVSVGLQLKSNGDLGGEWHTGRGSNLDSPSFDLSAFNEPVVKAGDPFGNTKLVPGEYVVTAYATNQDGQGFATDPTINLTIVEAVLLGDVNSDGEVTDKDIFVLGKFLAQTEGYTVDKNAADISKDGKITELDYDILSKYLTFQIEQTPSGEDSSVWKMSFSDDTLNIELSLDSGYPIPDTTYQFIAEKLIVDGEKKNYKHYYCDFIPTADSISFAIKKDLRLPRGQEYTFYVVPCGVTLNDTNREDYSLGTDVVPLYDGNMFEWVKSGNSKVSKGGEVVLGEPVTIRWNGSFGVNNFQLQIDINEKLITLRNYASDGPKEVEIPADLIMAGGVGKIVITGTVTANTSEGFLSETSVWEGDVIENPNTTPDYPDYIDDMPYDLAGEYQLARQIDAENSDILVAISKAISQGITENLKTYIWSNVSPDKYDQKEYETVITRILRNIPDNTATQIFDEIDKMASLGQDVYGGTQDAFSILKDLWKYGYTEEICEEIKTTLEPLKQFSDLSEKSLLLLIVQYKGQLEYFDALESQVPDDKSMKPLKDAICNLREAYKESYVAGVAKILAQYYKQEGFNEFVDFIFDGIKEGAGDAKIFKNVKLGNIFNGLSIADFAMTYGSKVLGITDYADASFDMINASAIESMASCAYMDALAKVKMAKDEATNKDYAYLAACYDLVRGCIITKNEYAMKIDSRYTMVAQLKEENEQIANRPYGMYQKNDFYMSDFMNAPDFNDLGKYYFNAIITGGAYSDNGIGYIAKYTKMSTGEKKRVKNQIELLSEFATEYQKSEYFTLELRESQEDIPTILIRTPENYYLGIAVYNGTGTIQVPCVFARHPDWDKEYDYLMSVDDGITAWGDIVTFDRINLGYQSVQINKAGVEKILRKFVDTQYNKSDVSSVNLGKELVVELFGEVLNIDNYWWLSAYDEVAYAMANSDIKNGYK